MNIDSYKPHKQRLCRVKNFEECNGISRLKCLRTTDLKHARSHHLKIFQRPGAVGIKTNKKIFQWLPIYLRVKATSLHWPPRLLPVPFSLPAPLFFPLLTRSTLTCLSGVPPISQTQYHH